MYDKLESHLRALESLGVTLEKYAAMLFPMVESSLPEATLVAWQRSSLSTRDGSNGDPPRSRLSFLMEFLRQEVEGEERISLAKAGFGVLTSRVKGKVGKENKEEAVPPTAAGLFSATGDSRQVPCVFCDKAHDSKECFKAQGMTLLEKRAVIKNKRCCYICFRSNHVARFCRTQVKCQICKRKHYTLMCPELPNHKDQRAADPRNLTVDPPHTTENVVQNALANQTCTQDVVLQTVMVTVVGKTGEKCVRALIDTGSQRSYILKKTANETGCEFLSEETIVHSLFGGISSGKQKHRRYKIILRHVDQPFQIGLHVLDQDQICGLIPRVERGLWTRSLKAKGIWLNDFGPGCPEIEILIGADVFGKLITGRVLQLDQGLTAVETRLGWTVMGLSPSRSRPQSSSMIVTTMLVGEAKVAELWELETIGIRGPVEKKSREESDESAWQQFLTTVKREVDGRYEVGLPWISEQRTLSSNRDIAERRLHSITRKLMADGRLQDYQNVFEDWLKEGIIEEVPSVEYVKSCHVLPHRPVFKEESVTTKVRPVFDASCKSPRSPSLNECLQKGPNLLEIIPAILLRFREKRIGVTADIRKAFLMVGVREEDRDYLRFLWWRNYETKELIVYRHRRVVFGVTCSPFLLGAVIRHHVSQVSSERKPVADQLLRSLYVDNCVTSVDTPEQLQAFMKESTAILAEAKLDLRMWQYSQKICQDNTDPKVAVLGLVWDQLHDTLSCEIRHDEVPAICTKRNMLSFAQRIFDPLGFLTPTTLFPKLLLQETWCKKYSWDQPVSADILNRFESWANELSVLSKIQVPRMAAMGQRSCWTLHTFCDASSTAYAAVVFLRCQGENTVSVQLLQARSRVAPLKKATIPRLELLACTVGSRLAQSVKTALALKGVPEYFWSDSTTALAWIKRNDEWGTFVGNRVREILSVNKAEDWNYVPGLLNPADLPSRGCGPLQLLQSRWWEGPARLQQEEEKWPSMHVCADEAAVMSCHSLPWYMRVGLSYSRLVRVLSWVFRFTHNAREKTHSKRTRELEVSEIETAEKALIKLVQSEVFPEKVIIQGLPVLIDNEGIIRVKTKITAREDTFDFRYPMLLPAQHPLVQALITEEHLKNLHAGTQFLMTKLREHFWILRSRSVIKGVIHKCVRCRRHESKGITAEFAPLPVDRVKTAAVFEIVGIDLAGPMYLKDASKVWMVLYTCAVYRAIHLELVTALSTECFLQSLRRFVSRRGRPSIIYSDHGSNFVGAENLFKALDWRKIVDLSTTQRIRWKFKPPTAAWWGGWWERLIKTIKGLLVRVLGRSSLNYEDLLTIMCEAEAVVNGRPLTYVTEDSGDLVPLTPSMFLQEIREAGVPEVDFLERSGFERRYRYRQKIREDLRMRFRKEYLGQLIQRTKELKKHRSLKVGEVVLVGADNKKRLLWPMARVVKLIAGRDGKARVAHVRTANGVLVRPVQRLYPLEVMEEDLVTEKIIQRAKRGEQELPPSVEIPQVTRTRSGREVKPPERLVI